nr:Chain B, Transmembrane protein 184 homolog C30D11.06c [Schizosaccharomyces pombe 972h-]
MLQFEIDDEMEPLYNQAKQMRYGDYLEVLFQ